jgi:GAF domain-containing protein
MVDQKKTDLFVAPTQKLPAVPTGGIQPAITNPGIVPARSQDEEKFLEEQEQIREMIAGGAPLNDILASLVLMIERQSADMIGSILLLSDDGNHVRHAVAPSLPQNYVKVIDGSPIGPKHGSCGTAMYRGEPVIVKDIATDPLWDEYRNFAWAIGVAACWSTPIMSSRGKVLGSFAMYYRESRTPTSRERHLTDVATKLAGEAIEDRVKRDRESASRT